MFCPNCGDRNPVTASLCGNCGNKLMATQQSSADQAKLESPSKLQSQQNNQLSNAVQFNFKRLFLAAFSFYKQHFIFLTTFYLLSELLLYISYIVGLLPLTAVAFTVSENEFNTAIKLMYDPTLLRHFVDLALPIEKDKTPDIAFLFSLIIFFALTSYVFMTFFLALLAAIKSTIMQTKTSFKYLFLQGFKRSLDGIWISSILFGISLAIIVVSVTLYGLMHALTGFLAPSLVQPGSLYTMVTGSILLIALLGTVIIPIFLFFLSFAIYLFEESKGFGACERAFYFMRRQPLRIIGYSILVVLITFTLQLPFIFLSMIFAETPFQFIFNGVNVVAGSVAAVFYTIFGVKLYLAIVSRAEGNI